MSPTIRTLLAIGSIQGEVDSLGRLISHATGLGADSVALVGDLEAASRDEVKSS
jgi:hypothetical protein